MIWWQKPCSGPYEQPCISYKDDQENIRLYQWCQRCLYDLSIQMNGGEEAVEARRRAADDAERWQSGE